MYYLHTSGKRWFRVNGVYIGPRQKGLFHLQGSVTSDGRNVGVVSGQTASLVPSEFGSSVLKPNLNTI